MSPTLLHTSFWFLAAALLASCASESDAPGEVPAPPEYVTAEVCATCHEAEAAAWAGSDHQLAMARATPETVRGDFDNVTFVHMGDETRFIRENGRYFVETEGPDGQRGRFEVTHTFGVRPLQQYLVELPRGHLQALTVAWDTSRERWFSLHPDEDVPPEDWRHWTGRGMNWNYMCAACHSTGLEKNFDLATNSYATTWSDINVSCESCHGPGGAHVEWARNVAAGDSTPDDSVPDDSEPNDSGPRDSESRESESRNYESRKPGIGGSRAREPGTGDAGADPHEENGLIVDLRRNPQTLIETCAPCHSRRRIVAPDFLPGKAYLDHYMPELLDEQLYFADGQIKDEVFVYGSFLQSRMYREGVTCSDCHDPHTLRLKIEGNELCTQCHAADEFDVSAHLNHPRESAGAACVNCHMPERTYMVVDPRRDHSFKVPRPDLSLEIGIPNACTTCHDDRSAEWASETVEAWYGPERSDSAAYGRIIAAARRGEPAAEEAISALASNPEMPPILRATAVSLLADYPTAQARGASEQALGDHDPLVRSAAVRAFEDAAEDDLFRSVEPLLADSVRAVRVEAARLLARAAHRFPDSNDAPETRRFHRALAEYRESQYAVADQPQAHLNLAVIHEQLDEWDAAVSRYETALRLDSSFVPAHLNLAMLQNRRREALLAAGRSAEADTLYDEIARRLGMVLEIEPGMAEAHYSLGLLLAEDESRLAESAEHLAEAARLSPVNARIHYNAGLAQQHLGRSEEAERLLRRAARLEPQNADYLNALAILYMQQERWDSALAVTDSLMAVVPATPELQRRRAWIAQQQRGGSDRE